jgi:hypothetical protein
MPFVNLEKPQLAFAALLSISNVAHVDLQSLY